MKKVIWIFGSNTLGKHGAGAAAYAMKHKGAIWGQGEGLQGESYALPTKGARIQCMPLSWIKKHVDKFIQFATEHYDEYEFDLTKVGTNLAGHTEKDIAPLFINTPRNVWLIDDNGIRVCLACHWNTKITYNPDVKIISELFE